MVPSSVRRAPGRLKMANAVTAVLFILGIIGVMLACAVFNLCRTNPSTLRARSCTGVRGCVTCTLAAAGSCPPLHVQPRPRPSPGLPASHRAI